MARPKKGKQRDDKRYEYKKVLGRDLTGKTLRKSFYSTVSTEDAKAKAEAYVTEREITLRQSGIFVSTEMRFKDWAEYWLKAYKRGKVKDNTYWGTFDNPTMKHLIPYFGKSDLKMIRPVDVQRFFDEKGKKYSLETMIKMRSCLRSIFETAIENDLCYKNPVTKNIKLASKKEPDEKHAWSQAQYDIALKFAKGREDGLSIWVVMETAVSRSELLGLWWDDILLKDGVIKIERGTVEQKDIDTECWSTVSDGLKNKYRQRVIPISPELTEALKNAPRTVTVGRNVKKGIPGTEVTPKYVFCSPTGKIYSPNNWSKRVFDPFMDDLTKAHPEVPRLSVHELRHTRTTLWKNSGIDMYYIARLLGHSNLDMLFKRYAHDDISSIRAALGYQG